MTPDLGARLAGLAGAVSLARGRCDPALLAPAEALLGRAAERRRLAPERTVVALAGGTGSGKSTLFNVLAGQPFAPTGVRRPTTSRARAAIWASAEGSFRDASPLLDWLAVRDRHEITGDLALGGLVLVDLPDFDSTAAAHRLEADRLTEVVDLLVWVLDPQKYADAAVHERYLRPLGTHGASMLVVLNQIDRLGAEADAARRHLQRLLADDGLPDVPVLATAATSGDGVAALQAELGRRVRSQAAAVLRLNADVDAAVAALEPLCAAPGRDNRRDARRDEDALVHALSQAAGADTVAEAVAADYRLRASGQVGWPPTRRLARLRVNPLRRLHLGTGSSGPTSIVPSGVARAQISNALRDLVAVRTRELAPGWRAGVVSVVDEREGALQAELHRAVRSTLPSHPDRPRWWRPVRATHLVLLLVAVAGALWLAVLATLGYLQVPRPSVHLGRAPLPTVLLVGGLVLGALLAVVARRFVAAGAARRRARARRSIEERVRAVARDGVLAPIAAELDAAAQFCAALDTARRR